VGADITRTSHDGTETHTAMVFQRRGDLLVATIGQDRARVLALAGAAAQRLEAADATLVGT
jgi:hypothetical protein